MSEPRAVLFPDVSGLPRPPDWLVGPQLTVRRLRLDARGAGGADPAVPPARALTAQERAPGPEAEPAPTGDAPAPAPAAVVVTPAPCPKPGPDPMEARDRFVRAALDLATARAQVLRASEGALLALSTRLASVLVQREVSRDPELHEVMARAALECLGDLGEATLRVSAETQEALQELHGTAVIEHHGVRVRVLVDPTIQGLGCLADNGAGRVDGRVTERLAEALRAFEALRLRGGGDES